MATKSMDIRVQLPIQDSFDVLRKTAIQLGDWKEISAAPSQYQLQWKTGSIVTIPTQVSATIKATGNVTSLVTITAKHSRPLDMWGHLTNILKAISEPFQVNVDQYASVRAFRIQQINEGLMCPTCGKSLQPGTKFCPNDQTQILKECPNCKSANIPSAKFCSNCSTKL